MYPVILEPRAEVDLEEAYRWYESQKVGLGDRFLFQVNRSFQRIAVMPQSCAVILRDARVALVAKFPYIVCYVFLDEQVVVVAVVHGRRDPEVWQSRVRRR